MQPASWAIEWGEDRFGPFMSFGVGQGVNQVVQRMRWVPPGRFGMGSPAPEEGRYKDEVLHEVELRQGFWLGEAPVTQALWAAVMGSNPSHFVGVKGGLERPVEQVSWEDCQGFIGKLNGLVPDLDARLPTEAEWERACRGGTTGSGWVDNLDAIAWYRDNAEYTTHQVKGKQSNPYGLYDMLGNVWEWCEDWFALYDTSQVVDPRGPNTGSKRVLRGGSWHSNARRVRAAYRYASDPADRYENLGFRVARGQAGQVRSGLGGEARRASPGPRSSAPT